MMGNSVKSGITPVLDFGGRAIHIPYEYKRKHEQEPVEQSVKLFTVLKSIAAVPAFLKEREKLWSEKSGNLRSHALRHQEK